MAYSFYLSINGMLVSFRSFRIYIYLYNLCRSLHTKYRTRRGRWNTLLWFLVQLCRWTVRQPSQQILRWILSGIHDAPNQFRKRFRNRNFCFL